MIALLLGPLDAARGGQFTTVRSSIGSAAYAVAVSYLLVGLHWTLPLAALAFMLGESMGWGCPLGSALRGQKMDASSCYSGLERWQIGPLAKNAWLALAARGYLWGLPVGLLGYFEPKLFAIPFVMMVAMVAAPALVRAANDWKPSDHLWGAQEWVRGFLVGGMLAWSELYPLLWAFGLMYLTWAFYLLFTALLRAKREGTISRFSLILGYPLVAVGAILDILLNVTVGTILFLELPHYKRLFLTARMARLIREDYGWRGDVAAWICSRLLDSFDPSGKHCD